MSINLDKLAIFKNNDVIDLEALIKTKIVSEKQAKKMGIKILDHGEISTSLTISLPISKKAAEKIIKAGGKVV